MLSYAEKDRYKFAGFINTILTIEQMFCIIQITECTKISASLPGKYVKQKNFIVVSRLSDNNPFISRTEDFR